jgi:amino acid permease
MLHLGLYIINLISGLLLADVAINLHESSECEVPSSFKDFVDATTKDETAGTLTAGASLLSNSCFLAYGTVAAGPLLVDIFPGLGLNPIAGTGIFASIICFITVTQNNTNLEKIANAIVVVVFSSFAALLMPSMTNVVDPVGAFLTPGTNPDGFSAASSAVPLLLSSLMYQNIVPSISKLLDFDRTKITIAVVIGSAIPMLMYIAWCYADLGGGLDNSIGSSAGAIAFTAFSASALFVSSLTAVMSLAEEYESIFSKTSVKDDDEDGDCPLSNQFSIPAVAASVLPSLVVAILCAEGGDLTGALHFNGAVIIPYLYGVLPIILFKSVRTLHLPTSSLPQRLKD